LEFFWNFAISSIDQKNGEICTGQADLQPISFKSDRLLVGVTFRDIQFGVSQDTDMARKIKILQFSQIVLELLFSIDYHYNEF